MNGPIIKLMQKQKQNTDQKKKRNQVEDKNVTDRLASGQIPLMDDYYGSTTVAIYLCVRALSFVCV